MKEELLKRLDALAAKLGVASEHIWQVLVKQAGVAAVENLIGILIGVAVMILGPWLFQKGRTTPKVNGDSTDLAVAQMVIGVVCLAVSVVVTIACVVSLPTLVMNPEYFALQKVMEWLGR